MIVFLFHNTIILVNIITQINNSRFYKFKHHRHKGRMSSTVHLPVWIESIIFQNKYFSYVFVKLVRGVTDDGFIKALLVKKHNARFPLNFHFDFQPVLVQRQMMEDKHVAFSHVWIGNQICLSTLTDNWFNVSPAEGAVWPNFPCAMNFDFTWFHVLWMTWRWC